MCATSRLFDRTGLPCDHVPCPALSRWSPPKGTESVNTNTQTHRHTDKKTHKHTNTQTQKLTSTQSHKHRLPCDHVTMPHVLPSLCDRQLQNGHSPQTRTKSPRRYWNFAFLVTLVPLLGNSDQKRRHSRLIKNIVAKFFRERKNWVPVLGIKKVSNLPAGTWLKVIVESSAAVDKCHDMGTSSPIISLWLHIPMDTIITVITVIIVIISHMIILLSGMIWAPPPHHPILMEVKRSGGSAKRPSRAQVGSSLLLKRRHSQSEFENDYICRFVFLRNTWLCDARIS